MVLSPGQIIPKTIALVFDVSPTKHAAVKRKSKSG
jgi:hypothetical protein